MTKRRLFEMFERVNKVDLKEWYDDDYGVGPEPVGDLDPNDMRQVQELHVTLTSDGIPDIYEHYPRWVVDLLKENGFVAEDPQALLWFFTPEGQAQFPTVNDLQNWLKLASEETSGNNDSEAPYLRGREDSNLSM